jgi:hypothetical protein
MTNQNPDRPSLRDFDAYADRNGQNMGQDSPLDVARPAKLQNLLNEDPGWQAETARIASGLSRIDSIEGGSIETSEATAAETPAETIRHISEPTLSPQDRDATAEAIARMAESRRK